MSFWTYIVASQRNGTLYVGSTNNLPNRIQQHREKAFDGFTARHGINLLVWYEEHPTREDAFLRERRIKKWNRPWKLELIERFNPGWRDLFDEFTGTTSDPAGEAARFVAGLRAAAASDNQQKKPGSPLSRG
ncbi:MAG TPA: GIY-YIG nuclease family protein [Caulobacteraceae bacterium]